MRLRPGSFSLRVPAQDLLLALFVTVMQVQGTIVLAAARGTEQRSLSDPGHLGFALLVLGGLAVAVRRRWPVAAFVTAGIASLVYYGLEFPDGYGWLGLLVSLYSVAAYGDGHRSLIVAGAGTGVLAAGWLYAAADVEPREAIGWVFFRIGVSVMSIALGESVRSRRVIAAEALLRAELAERTREEEARARVDAERLRIAREVHDTVAHAIAIINVQSGVTAHVLDKRPEQVREALRTIEQTSSRTLREMRAILGVLRAGDEEPVPHAGLDQLDALAAEARAAGLELTLHVEPPGEPLPSAVDSAAYRILQESITNIMRHTGPTRVTVTVRTGIDHLEIRVTDQGRHRPALQGTSAPGPPAHETGGQADRNTGRGIRGMRERCQLLGGDFHAGPTAEDGYEVTARLPLAPTEPRL
ncbi:sensor histidine kinase [Streptomyces sp. SBST2-5]|uniref:histidine kinase n=1 Tax=Streptomyces composti TaxID=2720025 RepID=A0ABX1AC38_9ACTN|nr:sensor histidine kinase [Streptomyces composti]NJP53965.1 sensor histidine kinase [Streptomyces composti]